MRALVLPILFRRSLLVAAAFGGLVSAHADDALNSALPESAMPGLRAVLANALQESEEIRSAELAQREADANRMQARSATLPRAQAYLNARQENYFESAYDGSKEVLIYQVSATQPLYHWGVRRTERQIGDLIHGINSIDASGGVERLASGVRVNYLHAVISRQSLELTDLRLAQKRRQLDFQREKAEAGQFAERSLEDSEMELERLELARLRDDYDWQSRLQELSLQVGMEKQALADALDPFVPEVPVFTPEQIESLGRLVDERVPETNEMRKKALAVEVARKTLDIERQSMKPKVDLQVGASQNGLDEAGVRRQLQFVYAGVAISWNLFDGYRSKGRKLEAVARLERNEQSMGLVENAVRGQIGRAFARLDLAARSLSIEERVFDRREEKRDKAKSDFEAQRISEVQYEEENRAFLESFIGIQRSRIEYLTAVVSLAQLLDLDPMSEETTL